MHVDKADSASQDLSRGVPPRRAFTLVEMLVVVGIIAMLIAILLPTLNKAREQSHWAVCMSNLNQIGNALMIYSMDNRGYLPRPGSRTLGQMPDDFIFWEDGSVALGYERNMDNGPLVKALNAKGERLKSLFRCPSDNYADRPSTSGSSDPYRYSYSLNRSWELTDPAPQVLPPRLLYPRPTLLQVRRPAEKVLVVEEQNPNDSRWEWTFVDPTTSVGDDRLAERHTKQTDILYSDMHVERKFWKDLVDDQNNQKHPFEPTAK